jgi:hypothetical protein
MAHFQVATAECLHLPADGPGKTLHKGVLFPRSGIFGRKKSAVFIERLGDDFPPVDPAAVNKSGKNGPDVRTVQAKAVDRIETIDKLDGSFVARKMNETAAGMALHEGIPFGLMAGRERDPFRLERSGRRRAVRAVTGLSFW